jgi:transposase
MSNQRYPEEFKIQAVSQVTEKQRPVAEVAARLGVSAHSLYAWIKRYSKPQEQRVQDEDQNADLRRLPVVTICIPLHLMRSSKP